MTKQEFVDAVADKSGLSKRDASSAVDAALGVIESTLQNGDAVAFTGFGKFHVDAAGRPPGREPPDRREGADPGRQRPEVLGRLAAEEGCELN